MNGGYVLRMIIASLCGAIIGIERGRRQKDAGIRTHIIVALGSAVMMIISKYGFFDVVIRDSVSVDASRVAANIITGVSFLGAGVIFVKDISIKGLTTASGIWCTSAIGMAIGGGLYTIGICATLLMLLYQLVLHRFFDGLENTANGIKVRAKNIPGVFEEISSHIEKSGIAVENCKIEKDGENILIAFEIKKPKKMSINNVLSKICENENVISAEG